VNGRADQAPAVFAHLHNVAWCNSVGSDCKISLSLPVVKIIKEDKFSIPQCGQSIVNHYSTSTVTVSVSPTPSFLRSATGAITSMMSSG
jgi:hypothetical protein